MENSQDLKWSFKQGWQSRSGKREGETTWNIMLILIRTRLNKIVRKNI